MGELSDFCFDIKYRPGRVNTDADTLSRVPLDIDNYVSVFTEELSPDVVSAAWGGSQAAQRKYVAWVAVLLATSGDVILQPCTTLGEISSDGLARAQREDPTIGEIIKLKESNDKITGEICRTVKGVTRKMLHEWNNLHVKNRVLYRKTPGRKQLVVPHVYQPHVLTHLHDNM